ncbi:MAG: hypothetical protein FJ304_09065 [Planctomycetes bacterium]|nr:hypothetical protein [Planctomycetota bacterium]
MKQVTIRRCPSCENIRGLTSAVQTTLKGEAGAQVNVVDGAKGEFVVEVDGKRVSGLTGEMLPTADEVTRAVRGEVGVGA